MYSNEAFDFIKPENFLSSEQLSTSVESLCSIDLVS
jgi:hypothetical protein